MAVLGDMLELGDHSLPEHQRALELCRKLKIRPLFTLGPQYAQIPASNNYSNVEDLVTEILKNVQANDVILFKASRSMKLEAALNLLLLRLKTER
jgi:UDP-N-acetylmuramoyl-tripeptide--D-alanyl-D-alanine ligase